MKVLQPIHHYQKFLIILKLPYLLQNLIKFLGDVQVVSDYLTIHTSDSKADFSGKGDSGEVVIDLEKESDKDIGEISSTEDSTRYIQP